jgi:anti-sigma B factor antagonist
MSACSTSARGFVSGPFSYYEAYFREPTHPMNCEHEPNHGGTIMSAKINIHHAEGVTVLEVSGRIVLGDGGITLRDSIQAVLKTGAKKLVVDMGGVNYMDSSGLGELTNAYTSAKTRGCDLKLARLTRKLDNLMLITKLATVFDIYPDEVKAVAAFSDYHAAVG